jgi:HD-like signal output (HDOD) protein
MAATSISAAIYAGVALLATIATGMGVIIWRRRRNAVTRVVLREVAVPEGGAEPPTREAAESQEVASAALERQLLAASRQLWARALDTTSVEYTIPPGHEQLLDAVRSALAAETLADRYFPRRPMLMPQLLAAVNDPDAPPMKLAAIIAQDPVLTGNILRLANTVIFRVSGDPVETIQRAVVVCGTDGLQSLAAAALVQPVFRGGTEAHSQFPAAIWERCMQASIAAEMCARQWCPQDRQAAQLLALLSALGPLVTYRVVQDQYRQRPALAPAAAVYLKAIDECATPLAARIAALWQSPPRLVAVLSGDRQDISAAAARWPLERALRAGELLATLSLLAGNDTTAEAASAATALEAGVPAPLFTAVWARLRTAPQ